MKKNKNNENETDFTSKEIEERMIMRQMKEDIRKEKIRAILAKYRKKIIAISSIAILIISTFIFYEIYEHNKSVKYSKLLHQVLFLENTGQNEDITQTLHKIFEDRSAPNSIKSLALMKYGSKLVAENKIEEAVETYIKASQIKNSDHYFTDLAGLLAIKSMIDSGNVEYYDKINDLISKFEKETMALKSFILEQKAIFNWIQGDKKAAYDIFYNLSLDVEAPKALKNRALEFSKIVK